MSHSNQQIEMMSDLNILKFRKSIDFREIREVVSILVVSQVCFDALYDILAALLCQK